MHHFIGELQLENGRKVSRQYNYFAFIYLPNFVHHLQVLTRVTFNLSRLFLLYQHVFTLIAHAI